jgi:hypothetical protein
MSVIETRQVGRVLRRWGFLWEDRLAFAGFARQSGATEIWVRVIETEEHAHSTFLPQRLRREQLIRAWVESDVRLVLGEGWAVRFQYQRRAVKESRLFKAILGTPQPHRKQVAG